MCRVFTGHENPRVHSIILAHHCESHHTATSTAMLPILGSKYSQSQMRGHFLPVLCWIACEYDRQSQHACTEHIVLRHLLPCLLDSGRRFNRDDHGFCDRIWVCIWFELKSKPSV